MCRSRSRTGSSESNVVVARMHAVEAVGDQAFRHGVGVGALGVQHQLVAEALELVVHRGDDVGVELVLQVGEQQTRPAGCARSTARGRYRSARSPGPGQRCAPGAWSPRRPVGSSRKARETVGWETPARRATSWLVTIVGLLPSAIAQPVLARSVGGARLTDAISVRPRLAYVCTGYMICGGAFRGQVRQVRADQVVRRTPPRHDVQDGGPRRSSTTSASGVRPPCGTTRRSSTAGPRSPFG